MIEILPPERPKAYIAGPITGLPLSESAAAFHRGEVMLGLRGYDVINPRARLDGVNVSHDEAMRICQTLLKASDVVVMLPGWRKSSGATMEVGMALAYGLPIYEMTPSARLKDIIL